MTYAPIAIVLGGTFPHRRLLTNLKERGFHTVLVDYHENPCARDCADEHVKESTLDRATVRNLAKTLNAELIISACIDQANVTACAVAAEIGLPHPYDLDTAHVVTNKALMKEFMIRAGVPTSRFISASDLNNVLDHGLQYPVIVKPVDSNSSKGVRRANNTQELVIFAKEAINASRSGEVIVEEFIGGIEVGADCFVHDDNVSVILTRQRKKIPRLSNAVQQIYGSIWPAIIPEGINDQLAIIATHIARSLGLTNCPLMMQAIIHDDSVSVIEFAARFGGGENFQVIELCTGVDIIDLSIRSFLGEKCELSPTPRTEYYSDNYLYAHSGLFGKITGGEELVSEGAIEYLHTYKTPGMPIGGELSSNNRVGAFVLKSANVDSIFDAIKYALSKIDVLDVDGHSIFRTDIY